MHGLIRADGHRPFDLRKEAIISRRQWLLDQLDPFGRRGGKKRFRVMGLPGFVGIDDEPRLGHRLPHCAEAFFIAIPAELELEQRVVARLTRLCRHRLGRAERQRESRRHGMERRKPCKLGHALARPLRLDVPQRTVERVPCGAGRQ